MRPLSEPAKAERKAYAWGIVEGEEQGRRDVLRLAYIGAACAEALYARVAVRDTSVPACVLQYVASEQAEATLHALASLGDEQARRILEEG